MRILFLTLIVIGVIVSQIKVYSCMDKTAPDYIQTACKISE